MQAAQSLTSPEIRPDLATGSVPATPQIRQSLVRKLADLLVLSQTKLTNNERDFIADILIRALENVDMTIRREISQRIAGISDIPAQLQRHLLREDIFVAEPLLAKTPRIQEPLLLEACQQGEEHRKIVATRDDLSQAVVDQLVAAGDVDVIKQVLRREDMVLSCCAMDMLVQRSESDEGLVPLLLRRPELRLDHGLTMFWWLNTAHRKIVIARFSTDRSIIQEAMHPLFVETYTTENPDLFVKSILKLIDRRHRPRGTNGETVTMDIVERTLKLARQTPTDEFCHAVGLLAGVDTETAGRCLRDFTGEAFAVLCKSIGLSRTAFNDLFADEGVTENASLSYSPEKIEDIIGVFDSIARDYSRTILRYWDWKHKILRELAQETSLEEPGGGYLGAI